MFLGRKSQLENGDTLQQLGYLQRKLDLSIREMRYLEQENEQLTKMLSSLLENIEQTSQKLLRAESKNLDKNLDSQNIIARESESDSIKISSGFA